MFVSEKSPNMLMIPATPGIQMASPGANYGAGQTYRR